jgi:hypothetical protein
MKTEVSVVGALSPAKDLSLWANSGGAVVSDFEVNK